MTSRGMRGVSYKQRREVRRRNHIAKDLSSPQYKHQVIPAKLLEDEEERRFRRYKELEE